MKLGGGAWRKPQDSAKNPDPGLDAAKPRWVASMPILTPEANNQGRHDGTHEPDPTGGVRLDCGPAGDRRPDRGGGGGRTTGAGERTGGVRSGGPFEVDFLTGMIDHHHMAVMMAEMCVEKAVHDQLAATCESIVATQSAEIATMQQWLEDWYGISHEPDMTGMQSMHRFHDLDGEEFEVAFLRSMIRHHWGAIREAEKCLANAEHDELLTLCTDIREAQLAEIAQMQDWLQEWYDLPGGRPVGTA